MGTGSDKSDALGVPYLINTLCSYCQALITEPDISVYLPQVSNIFAIVGDEIPIPVNDALRIRSSVPFPSLSLST